MHFNRRLAHLDLEGLVMDREVRDLRDQFATRAWSKQLYNGLYVKHANQP